MTEVEIKYESWRENNLTSAIINLNVLKVMFVENGSSK